MWQDDNRLTEQIFLPELQGDEKILWCGRPRRGLLFHAYDAMLIPFSLMWGGFAFFWEAMALSTYFKLPVLGINTRHTSSHPMPIIFPLWGIPFVLVGLYLIFGRFIVDALTRKHTFYAVTNQRVLIVRKWLYTKTQSLNLQQLPVITLSTKADGSGTISFTARDSFNTQYRNYNDSPPGFEFIAGARNVHDIILSAQRQLSR